MRSVCLLLAGVVVGLVIEASIAQTQKPKIVGLNHVAISVPNVEEAVTYYTKTMGFSEAFRNSDENGQPTLVYLQINRNTFLELQPANAQRPAGISHFGLQVDNMGAFTAILKERGATISETRVSNATKAVLSQLTDRYGVRVELLELPPESLHSQAMERWK